MREPNFRDPLVEKILKTERHVLLTGETIAGVRRATRKSGLRFHEIVGFTDGNASVVLREVSDQGVYLDETTTTRSIEFLRHRSLCTESRLLLEATLNEDTTSAESQNRVA